MGDRLLAAGGPDGQDLVRGLPRAHGGRGGSGGDGGYRTEDGDREAPREMPSRPGHLEGQQVNDELDALLSKARDKGNFTRLIDMCCRGAKLPANSSSFTHFDGRTAKAKRDVAVAAPRTPVAIAPDATSLVNGVEVKLKGLLVTIGDSTQADIFQYVAHHFGQAIFSNKQQHKQNRVT